MTTTSQTDGAVVYRPIGTIRSRFACHGTAPLQAAAAASEPLVVELFPAYVAGLRDLEGFGYIWLLTHLHQAHDAVLEVIPRFDVDSHGVFATRSPARPNRIGLSAVRLLRVESGTLHCLGNDLIDGTPVLDLTPYVPDFDHRETELLGWLQRRRHEPCGPSSF